MSKSVDVLCEFHTTRSYGSRANLESRSKEANRLYRELTEAEIAEAVERSLTDSDDLLNVLVSLACLHPGSLKPFHERFIQQRLFYPGLIYHEADERCSSALAHFIASAANDLCRNHLLLCMAWAGNAETQRLFARWRDAAPAWASELCVPPQAYAHEAGWELLASGERRDLFFHTSVPLVGPNSSSEMSAGVQVATPTDENCRWCGRQLISLLDFDPSYRTVPFLPLPSARFRVTTCNVCTAFGVIYSRQSDAGRPSWHPANVRPSYLPADSAGWEAFPERPLQLSASQRHFMESASWTMVPGIAFSAIGGLPTWIQDAEYPKCPDCSQTMLFIGQISNEDFDPYMEGIEYCFLCSNCKVAATSYQQS
jgi:hypothetical protein